MTTRILALAAPLLGACIMTSKEGSPAPNALQASERTAGMTLLFDGTSTEHWRGYKKDEFPGGWQALDGALTRVGEGGDLVTKEEYADFLFEFEWRVPPGANSGVMFHVSEDHEYPWETGPEYQILDNKQHPDGRDPRTSASSNYAMHAPLADLTKPPGEWNQSRLLVCGPHVEHWLNGQKVVEYELWSDDWKERVARCKWKDRPDYGQRKSGHIVLQDHGDRVSFRNLKIQRLEPAR